MSKSIKLVLAKFLYSSISRSSDKSNYYFIKEVEKKLIKNAFSIVTELGEGNYSYLELVLTPEKYKTITIYTFTPNLNPGTVNPILRHFFTFFTS